MSVNVLVWIDNGKPISFPDVDDLLFHDAAGQASSVQQRAKQGRKQLIVNRENVVALVVEVASEVGT